MATLKPGQPTDNEPHDTKFNPRRATAYGPGVTLFTRDGEKIGNGIIIKETIPSRMLKPELKVWLIQTDFGNKTRLTDTELDRMFTLGYERNYDEWWDDRLELIKASVND